MLKIVVVVGATVICAPSALAQKNLSNEGAQAEPSSLAARVVHPADNARIRLFGRNGMSVAMYENSACIGGGAKTVVSGSIGSTFASFLGKVANVRIGIKDTPTVLNMPKEDSMASKGYFREYLVQAGQPLSVGMSFSHPSGLRCAPAGSTFVPEAGRDYEGTLEVNFSERTCRLLLKQVQATNDDIVLADIAQLPAASCQ
ncbi:MAG: hypothetical protein WKG03_10955 [Telluria sp.]